ncbi:MAG: hypothetical protein E7471_04130 [Ruminococcaceae bacterium]|nr:hypothetical protein [Oscillospiraceae bacterium]
MLLRVSSQALEFCYCVLFGLACGVGYDVLRLLRKRNRKHSAVCLFLDACYGLISCLLFLWFVLNAANGEMRWYLLLGVFLGGSFYAGVFSKSVSRILSVLDTGITWVSKLFENGFYRVFRAFYRGFLNVRKRCKKKKRPGKCSGRVRKGEALWRKEKNASGSSHA